VAVLLEARDLKKTYRMCKVLVPALEGITFDVAEGEFVVVFARAWKHFDTNEV